MLLGSTSEMSSRRELNAPIASRGVRSSSSHASLKAAAAVEPPARADAAAESAEGHTLR
jgi:hypothetical protein|tara:strand:+ start:927 stop:1103 length:177 start_codon:yes stop_codon:yes gene_type:complete